MKGRLRLTEVRVDNETSERFRILEVVADDRRGLLFIIAQVIFRLGLSVHEASIATRQDRAVDAFPVTDGEGQKIVDGPFVTTICAAVTDGSDRFLGPGISPFAGAFDAVPLVNDGL